MSEEQEIRDLQNLTAVLMDFGWFVPPFIMRGEVSDVETLTNELGAKPPVNAAEKKAAEERIHRLLMDAALSTKLRARFVWLAMRTPYVQEYSHIYESAVHAYYKREYAAAICLLLPLFEGVLLSLIGFKPFVKAKKPSFADLTAAVTNLAPININPVMNAFQDVMRSALAQFVSRWLYLNTEVADITLSVLNRHYVLHGMEPGNFYRPQDVHRLLFAMDLLIELIAIRESTWRPVIENNDTIYEAREFYYRQLRDGAISVGFAGERGQELLREHGNYVQPTLEAIVELRIPPSVAS